MALLVLCLLLTAAVIIIYRLSEFASEFLFYFIFYFYIFYESGEVHIAHWPSHHVTSVLIDLQQIKDYVFIFFRAFLLLFFVILVNLQNLCFSYFFNLTFENMKTRESLKKLEELRIKCQNVLTDKQIKMICCDIWLCLDCSAGT